MRLQDQHHHCANFFMRCMGIFNSRAKEYAPEDVPMWDVFLNAVKEDVSVMTVLRILMDKHVTAIRHYDLAGRTLDPRQQNGGSTIEGRFQDIANFAALQSFYVAYQTELHDTWRNHLVQSCLCECDDVPTDEPTTCDRCRAVDWLDRHRPSTKVPQPASAPWGLRTGE